MQWWKRIGDFYLVQVSKTGAKLRITKKNDCRSGWLEGQWWELRI